MTTTNKYLTTNGLKTCLRDYVSKREFGEFRGEMRNFRQEFNEFRGSTESRFNSMEKRFNDIDKRFNDMDKRFDELKEDFRVHTGILLEQFREELRMGLEYVQNVDIKKAERTDLESLKKQLNERLFQGRPVLH